MRPSLVAAALVAAATLGTAGVARADTTRADALFARGKELVAAERYAEACPILAESVRLEPGIGARLWLGDCYERSGRLDAAFVEFDEAARAASSRGDEREKVAVRHREALRSRLSLLVIVAPRELAGLALELDGAPVPADALPRERPVAPGSHTISATAPGRQRWGVSIDIPRQPDTTTVNVPLLTLEPSPSKATGGAPAASENILARPPDSAAKGTSPWKIASIAIGAVGIGALGGGAFLGFQAKAVYDSSNRGGHCVNDACDATGKELRRDASSTATLSTLVFAGAGALLGASLVMYVFSPSTSITPAAGRGEAGLYATHRF